ncbi:MAG: FliH/SctL family protein [bacterium]
MPVIKKGKFKDKGILHLRSETPVSEKTQKKLNRSSSVKTEVPMMESVQETAHSIIAEAQAEAEDIIESAQEKAEEIKERAKADGYEAGRSEGVASLGEKTREALETINAAIKERKKIIKDAEPELLRLSLKVAEQIVRSEVSLHKDVCANIVSEAISRISDREQIIVKVNREDIDQVKKAKPKLTSALDGVKNFSIIEDNTIEPGGCVIETALGYVDARLKTRLAAISEAFEKVKKSSSNKRDED